MSEPAGNLVWLSHPRLAASAMSALPAWLWSIDATRLLWANPAGAAIFDAPTSAAIRASTLRIARACRHSGRAPRRDPAARRRHAVRAAARARRRHRRRPHLRLLLHHALRPDARHPGGRDRARGRRLAARASACAACSPNAREPIAAFSSEGNLIHASAAAQAAARRRDLARGARRRDAWRDARCAPMRPAPRPARDYAEPGRPAHDRARRGRGRDDPARHLRDAAASRPAPPKPPRRAAEPVRPIRSRRGAGERAERAAAFRLAGGCRASLHGRLRGIRGPDGARDRGGARPPLAGAGGRACARSAGPDRARARQPRHLERAQHRLAGGRWRASGSWSSFPGSRYSTASASFAAIAVSESAGPANPRPQAPRRQPRPRTSCRCARPASRSLRP